MRWIREALRPVADANRLTDPLPEEFGSEQEAPEFWHTHNITGYEESLEPVELDADIQRRHFEIEVDQEGFLAVRETARKQQKSVKQIASEILTHNLRAG